MTSSDSTFEIARAAAERLGFDNVTVLRTPYNRGYGGNQKLGYLHAMKQGFDYIIFLHGDEQYAPRPLKGASSRESRDSDAPALHLAKWITKSL